ncbi:hypothetical protein DRP05_13435 [Archaeoglobales archaeon]|nr:MAG: hypothetical protein DRP05_13435 [Archaeoglobales archaeon]
MRLVIEIEKRCKAVCYVDPGMLGKPVKELEIECRYDDELFEYLKTFYKFRQSLLEEEGRNDEDE